ncbi:MAG TPA: SGNH/GDSL hydrolase family protein [Bacillota bacterium]|nr:SGNH/GDSL hydrolase family protein [Bacillota bacterium]
MAKRDKIICLGDSITYGYPYGPDMSWVKLCAASTGLNMLNRGINGDTTAQMRRRFNYDVLAAEPACVIVMGGTNDVWVGFDGERMRGNIKSMAMGALKNGICPVLGLPVPVSLEDLDGFLPGDVICELALLRDWISDFAEENLLPVLDFYTPLLNPVTGEANPDYFMDDSHPNAAGYRVLAGAAEKVLLNLKKGLLVS